MRYLRVLTSIGVLQHLDGSRSAAALKLATKIVALTPNRRIYEVGALDIVKLSADLQLEDIRYALTRAKCPVAREVLKLAVFEQE